MSMPSSHALPAHVVIVAWNIALHPDDTVLMVMDCDPAQMKMQPLSS